MTTTKTNYRKIYEKACDIKIPKKYIIHHIDFDRTNNNISNLVMLPNSLHTKYHNILDRIRNIDETKYMYELPKSMRGSSYNHWLLYEKKTLGEKFLSIYNECLDYIMYRDYLLGMIPITHNVQLIINQIGEQNGSI